MPTTTSLPVKDLKLDLSNFRTVPQATEGAAISALVSINPDWFWALTESLLNDGYHPTENILVLQGGKGGIDMQVKEGNRRVAALKLIHGYAKRSNLSVPNHLEQKIAALTNDWKNTNALVPCAVYTTLEAEAVDRAVTRIHGKGEKAGRDPWGAVPRARHNRDRSGGPEPGLDLLEKYLKHGKNITDAQRERWAGEYSLSVLDEALKRLAPRLGESSARDVADKYPKGKHRAALEKILHNIGLGLVGFEEVRRVDFAIAEGISAPTPPPPHQASSASPGNAGAATGAGGTSSMSGSATGKSGTSKSSKMQAVPSNDPRAVTRVLKQFRPVGNNREKLAALLVEARKLRVDKTPMAFCFVLRSMFELSAKAYCQDHSASGGPSTTKKNGDERTLAEVLRDITKHLTKNNKDKAMVKVLHGAMTELGDSNGFLSVTSMNQLIHHLKFITDGPRVTTIFANVFPLLEAMSS